MATLARRASAVRNGSPPRPGHCAGSKFSPNCRPKPRSEHAPAEPLCFRRRPQAYRKGDFAARCDAAGRRGQRSGRAPGARVGGAARRSPPSFGASTPSPAAHPTWPVWAGRALPAGGRTPRSSAAPRPDGGASSSRRSRRQSSAGKLASRARRRRSGRHGPGDRWSARLWRDGNFDACDRKLDLARVRGRAAEGGSQISRRPSALCRKLRRRVAGGGSWRAGRDGACSGARRRGARPVQPGAWSRPCLRRSGTIPAFCSPASRTRGVATESYEAARLLSSRRRIAILDQSRQMVVRAPDGRARASRPERAQARFPNFATRRRFRTKSIATEVDAIFHAGWIALRFLDEPAKRRSASPSPRRPRRPRCRSLARLTGAAAPRRRLGRPGRQARLLRVRAPRAEPIAYYGQLAAQRLGAKRLDLREPSAVAEGADRDESVRAVERSTPTRASTISRPARL